MLAKIAMPDKAPMELYKTDSQLGGTMSSGLPALCAWLMRYGRVKALGPASDARLAKAAPSLTRELCLPARTAEEARSEGKRM